MSPRRVPSKKQTASGLPTWAIVVGVGALAVIAMGVLFIVQSPRSAPAVSDLAKTGSTKGDLKAPVEIIEVSDFQ